MKDDSHTDAAQSGDGAAPRKVHSTHIAAELEAEIISGDITAGTRLDEQSLTRRFGVSRTPVREALHTLVARSLAERIHYRGVVVTEITRDRVEQMFDAMGEIEAMCGRLSAERMSIGERAGLEDLHRRMGKMMAQGDTADYETANGEFHTMILEGTHNPDLIELGNKLRLKLAPFRKSQLRSAERIEKSNAEHAAIVNAILDRDPAEADRTLRRHLISAAREVLARMP
ncbi:GntR family transcriptional regulator [Meridianimarinicoccus aquatilis]|uniref:GntR family transcriptional regulator n=1 Tax=Meridianimarinicoccus aquatilis TaxID=2552766 RepID=A0A4R6AX41_9RHOB|nr:GntR family transcriptional regulator [Fluviibacterium aquatile]TDL86896.1 GntR family transcriptional regulator [Fluviibacterium aquatile]